MRLEIPKRKAPVNITGDYRSEVGTPSTGGLR